MSEKLLLDNVTGSDTGPALALISSQAEIYIKSGTFTSVTFEDSKRGGAWWPIKYAIDGSEVELTEGTNELELIAASNVGRKIRAVYVGAVGLTIGVDEGVL